MVDCKTRVTDRAPFAQELSCYVGDEIAFLIEVGKMRKSRMVSIGDKKVAEGLVSCSPASRAG